MKNKRLAGILLMITVLLAGCGGGSGNGNGTSASGKVVALIKVVALSTTAEKIGAISATITFPDGIFAKTDVNGAVAVADVVQLLNPSMPAGTIVSVPDYLPATAGQPGLIKFTILNADGFNATEEIAINLQIRSGSFPKSSDFALTNFIAKDLNGADVTLNPTLSATVQ